MSANAASLIASQVVPTLWWGGTGLGKSATAEALARALKRTFVPLLGSTHLPEDFSGYPTPDNEAKIVRMMPTTWVSHTFDGNALVFLDEVTNVPAATQAGLLSVITERRVGDYVMPASTLMIGAANPPHLCPNATPLAPAMRARFAHFDWEVDWDAWFAGLRAGCNWQPPKFPIVPACWTDQLAEFGSLVESFLRSAPDCREKLPLDDETMSFPNCRTWTYLVRCFAAATAAGLEKRDPVFSVLAKSCVGPAAGMEFCRFWHQLDLLDPESVLSGRAKYKYERRPDANICLLSGLVRGLRSNSTPERWTAAAHAFIEVGKNEIESMLIQFRSFWNAKKDGGVRPDGWAPPADVMQQILTLVKQ